ncbi:MAG: RidA family protein [Firmicutes bacterium]|jgi:2-iminobutanoate/2-iminopropanoate deaminase|nr:RidA family protein [Bacillota bacterium]
MSQPKRQVQTSEAPQAVGPYSQAIVWNGLVFVSGQIPIERETGAVLHGSIKDQTELVLREVEVILKAAGSDLSRVIKSTVFLKDMSDFQAVNEVYARYFKEAPPARACVAVKDLPKGAEMEIEVIAHT